MSQHNPIFRLNLFRAFLAFYFLLYSYVVGIGMIPLPDEPPRIHFLSLFCLVGGVVIAYHCLTSKFRLFQISIWLFIPLAIKQLHGKIRFLEMMLESNDIQKMTQYSLVLMLVILMTPKAFQTFSKSAKEYKSSKPLVTREGVRF